MGTIDALVSVDIDSYDVFLGFERGIGVIV
jgi:hypothetical protein